MNESTMVLSYENFTHVNTELMKLLSEDFRRRDSQLTTHNGIALKVFILSGKIESFDKVIHLSLCLVSNDLSGCERMKLSSCKNVSMTFCRVCRR